MMIFKYILPIVGIILSFFVNIEILLLISVVYFSGLYLIEKNVFYRMKNKFIFIFIFILMIIYPLTGSSQGLNLPFGLNYDFELMFISIRMCLRALLLFSIITQLTSKTKSYRIEKIFIKLGIRNYDELISESNSIMPNIKSNLYIFWKQLKNKEIKLNSPIDMIAIFLADLLKEKEIIHNLQESSNE